MANILLNQINSHACRLLDHLIHRSTLPYPLTAACRHLLVTSDPTLVVLSPNSHTASYLHIPIIAYTPLPTFSKYLPLIILIANTDKPCECPLPPTKLSTKKITGQVTLALIRSARSRRRATERLHTLSFTRRSAKELGLIQGICCRKHLYQQEVRSC